MDIFITLFIKLIPLYLIIVLGYVAGKFLKVQKESIAPLLIYVITPVVVFNGVITTQLNASYLTLPLLFFCISSVMCLLVFKLSKHLWTDTTRNMLAFMSGTANTGYFGLPVAIVLFGEQIQGLVVLSILGFVLFENSLGFFITARGHHTAQESLLKVLKLPSLYAFLFGVLINFSGINLGQIYTDTAILFRGTYTILGMMLIGLGLSGIREFKFDLRFITATFITKFVIWPIVIVSIILVDSTFFHLYDSATHKVMLLMSIVPLAANSVAYATQLKAQPEKASLAVLLSTIFALFYIPLITLAYLAT